MHWRITLLACLLALSACSKKEKVPVAGSIADSFEPASEVAPNAAAGSQPDAGAPVVPKAKEADVADESAGAERGAPVPATTVKKRKGTQPRGDTEGDESDPDFKPTPIGD